MDEINARLIDCFKIVFPDTPEERIPEVSTENTAAWDSIAAITLMNVIEEEFHIPMDFEEIADMNSFAKARAYVQQRL